MVEKHLAITNNLTSFNEVQRGCFFGEQIGFDYISTIPAYIPSARKLLKKSKLGAVIDYPYGFSSTQVRLHSALENLRKGADCIDLCLNTNDLVNNRFESIIRDLLALTNLIDIQKKELRVILEYRLLTDEQLNTISEILTSKNIYRVILGTGTMVENLIDNVIVAHELKKYALLGVVNGVTNASQIQTLVEYDVEAVIFNSVQLVQKIWGIK